MKRLLILFLMAILSFGIETRQMRIADLQKESISVTVQGEVTDPGPVEMHPYATVGELLEKVHVTDSADLSGLNPDTVLNDHDLLNIPEKREENPRISINTAGKEELMRLPGIGETMAENIIAYRNENGLFQKKEDLRYVKGIGPSKYEKLEDLITL